MSYPPPPGSSEPHEPTGSSEPTGATGPPPPPPYGPGAGQPYQFSPQPPQANSSKAVISLVLGIIGLVMCGLFLGIPAMVLARQAKREIRESNGAIGGEGLATAGFVTGLLATLWSLLVAALFMAGITVGGETVGTGFQESCVMTQTPDGTVTTGCD